MTSIYSKNPDAIRAGELVLQQLPDMRFQFRTNADGGLTLDKYPTGTAKALLDAMDSACGGFSASSVNEAFSAIQMSAKEMGRTVSSYKDKENYFTEISPVRN